jgi:cytochrome b subunit of formate dehydrogenase
MGVVTAKGNTDLVVICCVILICKGSHSLYFEFKWSLHLVGTQISISRQVLIHVGLVLYLSECVTRVGCAGPADS